MAQRHTGWLWLCGLTPRPFPSYTCGNICDTYAPEFGFAAVALQGVGADTPSGASWNGAGSTGSPGPRGATCLDTTTNYCYDDCKGGCSDNCWWTTCSDSVGFVEATLDAIEAAFCVNTSAVWATGGSNGGIFVYELASDARMAGRLAGIAPVTGLPHKGFLQPARGLHYISMLGATDGTVPPFSAGDTATDEPDISVTTSYSPGGWYFHTARATSDAWADANDCGKREPTSDWRIGEQGEATGGPLDCTARRAPGGADVVECIFPAGHVSYLEAQWIVILDFMRSHSRLVDFASKSSSL